MNPGSEPDEAARTARGNRRCRAYQSEPPTFEALNAAQWDSARVLIRCRWPLIPGTGYRRCALLPAAMTRC